MAEERIQKIMAEQGLCSRRAAEQIIAEGRVKVNGHPVKVGDKMDPNRDVLHVDDERIYIQKNQQLYYLALYKPRGYVTTASDELGRKTVMELVADIPARLYPVGRLDKDSEGLLLMTNDGAFAQAVTHPSGGISKEVVGIPEEGKFHPGEFEAMCNPIAQAKLLNEQHTEFNIEVGLCVGHDSMFYKYSDAMVTTLVAKDRVLAHNPCGAIYCAEGYFKKRLE